MAGRFAAFVISMRDNANRRAQAERIATACPIPCTILDAVDGRTLPEATRDARCGRALHRPRYPFALRPAEIGCFLSHRRAWQEILDRDLDGGLILEDDVDLDEPGFGRALEVAFDALRSADLVRLRLMHRTDARRRRRTVSMIDWPIVTPLGTQAQVVGRAGASRLLAASQRFDRPVDVFIQMRWVSGIAACEVSPSHVRDLTVGLGGSTIQSRGRGITAQISRSLARARYRACVRWLSLTRLPRPPGEGVRQ